MYIGGALVYNIFLLICFVLVWSVMGFGSQESFGNVGVDMI